MTTASCCVLAISGWQSAISRASALAFCAGSVDCDIVATSPQTPLMALSIDAMTPLISAEKPGAAFSAFSASCLKLSYAVLRAASASALSFSLVAAAFL